MDIKNDTFIRRIKARVIKKHLFVNLLSLCFEATVDIYQIDNYQIYTYQSSNFFLRFMS